MKPGGQRKKGHAFECKVANMFKKLGYTEARRGLTQAGGAVEPDVVVPGFGYWVECKVGKKIDLDAALEQAEKDMCKIKFELRDYFYTCGPIVVFKYDGSCPVFVATYEDTYPSPARRLVIERFEDFVKNAD